MPTMVLDFLWASTTVLLSAFVIVSKTTTEATTPVDVDVASVTDHAVSGRSTKSVPPTAKDLPAVLTTNTFWMIGDDDFGIR